MNDNNSKNSRIKLYTHVPVIPIDKRIRYGDKIVSIGSCFSENIGKYLYDLGYNISANPFGNQYNPLSIAKVISMIMDKKEFDETELLYHNGLYSSFFHHSRFSHYDKNAVLDKINKSLAEAKSFFENIDFLIITWGTAYTYRLKDTQEVVSNCHKLPEKYFDRNLESVSTMFEVWDRLIDRIVSNNRNIRIITSVSPIRHLRDTAHGNNISKSTLMIFDDMIRHKYHTNMYYFGAYEIILDELRDYRYYDKDLCHPSELAIDIVKERFRYNILDENEEQIRESIEKLRGQILHRPINLDEMSIELRMEQLNLQKQMFATKFPNVRIENI